MLTSELKRRIRAHAWINVPRECCGLIFESGDLECCQNLSKTPEKHFLISPIEVKKFKEKHGKIWGFYHSHAVSDSFSREDTAVAHRLKLNCVLYNTPSGAFSVYEPPKNPLPYLSRPFALGTLDCLTLAIDYYKQELNIDIADFYDERRAVTGWDKLPENTPDNNFLKEHFMKHGFHEVKEPQKHDLILTSYGNIKCPIHCLIYLGDNLILHHPPNSLSLNEWYNFRLKRQTKAILRHKSQL